MEKSNYQADLEICERLKKVPSSLVIDTAGMAKHYIKRCQELENELTESGIEHEETINRIDELEAQVGQMRELLKSKGVDVK